MKERTEKGADYATPGELRVRSGKIDPGPLSYWLDRPENVAKLYYGVWVVGLLLLILDVVVHRHDEIAFAETHGFYAAYGFFACVALVLAAKGLRRLLKRAEDYYER